ncbi:hypothetical protein SAY86_012527 [Trapa natans]|uniref:Pentatricopeptide repeat-containing protein n=1 Tax=Trapa natans TaxID=22666 RepID=A0AAN7LSA8_TRANT|nr:hypothetical protein SAY86_012527 [Trapa natans]
MIVRAIRLWRPAPSICLSAQKFSSSWSPTTSLQDLELALTAAVQTRSYQQIPDILNSAGDHCRNPSIFSFLAGFPERSRTQIVHEILRSLAYLRPRSRNGTAYSCLLFHTLRGSDPFPLSLAILQRTLRSGCIPFPYVGKLLSTVWLEHCRDQSSIAEIFLSMNLIGYSPCTGTCNYVVWSLCAADQLEEAMTVLKGMNGAGCIPDSDTYGSIICRMCDTRRCSDAVVMLKKMFKSGLMPREETVKKVAAALKINGEARKGIEMIELLEKEEFSVGLETYEMIAEGCLKGNEHILAAKAVMLMTKRRFIPHIKVRQKVVEGLASIGEFGLLHAIRQRLTELGS